MLELYYFVYFIFAMSILVIFFVWHSNLHKDPRIATLLQLVTALTILFTVRICNPVFSIFIWRLCKQIYRH